MNHFLKYVGIGGLSTLIQFLLLGLFIKLNFMPALVLSTTTSPLKFIFNQPELTIAPEVLASSLSYFSSSIFNYLANYHLTFASNTSHRKTLPKFMAATSLGLTANTSLFAVFFALFGHYLVAQCLATGITVFLNFTVHKLWIYKGH
jgi:putative flippase GtrA